MSVAIIAPHAHSSILSACGVLTVLHLRRGGVSRLKEFLIVSQSSRSVPRSMWSPFHRALALVTIFGMVFGGILLTQPINASAQTAAVTTDSLNLRSGPGTDNSIILVIPAGASVSLDGGSQNGFLSLTYNGSWGWAHGDWISTGGSAPVTNPGATGTTTVVDGPLNLRTGPSTGNSVITVMPYGASMSLTGEVSGEWVRVVYNGTTGWAHSAYLGSAGSGTPSQPSEPSQPSNPGIGDTVIGTMVTTDSLNMRSGPSTGNSIITTIPRGATVELMGNAQGAWYPVRYAGNKGWSHGDWLSSGGSTPAPTPDPTPAPTDPGGVDIGDTVVGEMTVTVGLNLRSGPGTNYGVLLVMPAGVGVSVMGDPVNGFYPITFHGTKGWASGDYLRSGAPSPGQPNPGGGSYTHDEIIQIIYAAADEYGQPRADMLRVAQCESTLNPNAVNASSGASGLFQFMPGTWAITPFANEDIFDPVMSAKATGWMWQNGMRNHWVCQ